MKGLGVCQNSVLSACLTGSSEGVGSFRHPKCFCVLQASSILVLDSYFYVVVFHGTTIAQWRKERYQEQAEHAAFKQLLEVASWALELHVPPPPGGGVNCSWLISCLEGLGVKVCVEGRAWKSNRPCWNPQECTPVQRQRITRGGRGNEVVGLLQFSIP